MPRSMPLRTALAAVLAPVVLALAGCGDEEPVRADGRELRVELDEFRVIPQNSIVSSGRLRIVATNVGRLPHNL